MHSQKGRSKKFFAHAQTKVILALYYTFWHSITLFCTDLGLIDMFLTNQNAEIVACLLLLPELHGTKSNYQLIVSVTNFGI